jgi:PAS domain S-box-containing protein
MSDSEQPDRPPDTSEGPPAASLDAPQSYRRIVESLPAVVYVQVDRDPYPTTYLSPRIEQVLGFPVERLNRDFWISRLHPDDRDRILAAERSADQTKEHYLGEFRIHAADGRIVWLRDEAEWVAASEEEPAHWLGVFSDITAQKELEQELREAAARFRTLVEQIPAVVYIDPLEPPPYLSLYVSPYLETMTGVRVDEAITHTDWWPSLIHPEDRQRAQTASNRADETGEPYTAEYRMVRSDGGVVWIHDQAVIVRDDEGRPLFWQGVMYDITDRKRAEQDLRQALELERNAGDRLREADELKNTFLTAVSHDLRTPLASILGIAVTLEQEGDVTIDPDDRRAMLHSLAAKTRELTALVTDLLDLDRLRRGVAHARLADVDLRDLIERLVLAQEPNPAHPVELELGPVRVAADAGMVGRIVENLLNNAVRHTPPGTHVWVRLDARDGGAELAVDDDGPGVPDDRRKSLFAPFERGPSANPQSPGAGVGLSLVARFAQLHGGRAWVQGRPGGGASFRVWLPGSPPAERAGEPGPGHAS